MASASSTVDDLARADLLARVPADARRVLEIAPRSTALREAIARVSPGVAIDAIDDPRAEPPGAGYDCVIFDRVLARGVDPAATLRRHAARLTDDGIVVACVPNALHWSVVADRLRGRGADDPVGPMSVEEAAATFRAAGLVVHDATPRRVVDDGLRAFLERGAPLLAHLGVEPARAEATASVPWHVLRAGKRPLPGRRTLVQTITMRPQVGMIDVRVAGPDRALGTIPGVRTLASPDGADLRAARGDEQKVLVWQRPIFDVEAHAAGIRNLTERGWLLVVEVDDLPFWEKDAKLPNLTYRAAHAVQTSTPHLAEQLRALNPDVAVFGNHLPELPPPRAPRDDAERVTLFYGALNREADWRPYVATVERVLRAHGDRVALTVVHDRAFFDAVDVPHKTFVPTCGYARYLEVLRGCDVAFLPLADTPFSRCKSDLKLVECAGNGVAVLASPVVYGGSIVEGETGVTFADAAQLARGLDRLLGDHAHRAHVAASARAWVGRERLHAHHHRARHAQYEAWLADRERLVAAARARAPEIYG